MPKLYIIAGCNGAGKTTASFTILPEMLNCKEFVNPEETIQKRYTSGIKNLFKLYLPVCDYWLVIHNSINPFQIIAEGKKIDEIEIKDKIIWDTIKKLAHE